MHKIPYLHVFLFSIYPIIFLLAHNIYQTNISVSLIPILLSLVFATLILSITRIVVKNVEGAALIGTITILLFFMYGHVHSTIDEFGLYMKHRYLYTLFFFVVIIVVILVSKVFKRETLKITNTILNVAAITLISFTVIYIAFFVLTTRTEVSKQSVNSISLDGVNMPDVYFIVLDGYASYDTLLNIYDYNNIAFIEKLEKRGFVVPRKSTSNYVQTFLSVTSTLNMEYINYITKDIGISEKDRTVPYLIFQDNKTRALFIEAGYEYSVLWSSGWAMPTYDEDVKTYWHTSKLNEFHYVLASTTALKPFINKYFANTERQRIIDTINILKNMSVHDSPRFIFYHLMPPHAPYLFNADGSPVIDTDLRFEGDVWADKEKYLNQLIFISDITIEVVDAIISNSVSEPIIVIISDHGPYLTGENFSEKDTQKARLRNFMALRLPHNGNDLIYDTISSVNLFRLIANYCFDLDYPLLEDKNYWSDYDYPYDFKDVTIIVSYD